MKKNNAEYYTHDSGMRNDVKIKALRKRFSHMGYAVWNFLLETLTDENDFRIKLDDIRLELMACDFDVTVSELKSIIDYCVKIDLLQMNGSVLSCKTLTDRFEPLMNVREKRSSAGKIGMQKRWNSKDNATAKDNKTITNDNNVITSDNTVITNHNNVITNDNKTITPDNKVRVRDIDRVKKIDANASTEESASDGEESYPAYALVEFRNMWNDMCGDDFPKVSVLTAMRKVRLKARITDMGGLKEAVVKFQEIFQKMKESDFMHRGGWKPTFDWVLESDNWLKVLEGNYDNKSDPSATDGNRNHKSLSVNAIWNQ